MLNTKIKSSDQVHKISSMDYRIKIKKDILRQLPTLPCCRESFLVGALHGSQNIARLKAPKGIRKLCLNKIREILKKSEQAVLVKRGIKFRGLDQLILRKKFVDRIRRISSESSSKHCLLAFFCGLFFSRGYLQNPSKAYHLEFRIKNNWLWTAFKHAAYLLKLKFSFHETAKYKVAYLKSGNKIIKFLNKIGLFERSVELSDFSATKKILGMVNRQVNFETANINKTISAAERLIERIRILLDKSDQDFWSEKLRYTALMRLKYPHDSIENLGKRFQPNLSKSAVNHRLRRINSIYEKQFEINKPTDWQ